jgi:hypothetical protein
MFQESDRKFREMSEETNKTIREMSEDSDRRFREMSEESERMSRETDRAIKEMSRESQKALQEAWRIVGNLGNKLGVVVEHLVLSNIKEKFNALGYGFYKTVLNMQVENKEKDIYAEVDAMLESGEYTLIIEVKTQLKVKDVDDHLDRLDKLRLNEPYSACKFLGAVAGAIVADNVKKYALKKGFYVIRQSGDTVTIENPGGFKPREW